MKDKFENIDSVCTGNASTASDANTDRDANIITSNDNVDKLKRVDCVEECAEVALISNASR